jgi:hypothetical protein
VPALGISAYHAWTFVIGHSVWSIAVPIALVELLFLDRARTPWLGRVGLALIAVGYLAGCLTGLRPSPTRHVVVGLGLRAPVER